MLDGLEIVPAEQAEDVAVHTMACIDVRVPITCSDHRQSRPHPRVLERALRQIEKAVRAEDRICPIGIPRIAVEFGPVASAVLPQVLGDRLAGAISQDESIDPTDAGLAVSVGMVTPEHRFDAADSTRRALAAAAAGSTYLGSRHFGGTPAAATAVTVDRLLVGRAARPGAGPRFQSLHRRSVYRQANEGVRALPSLLSGPGADDGTPLSRLTVLVVDPMAPRSGPPGLAAQTAAAIVDAAGCRTAIMSFSLDDQLALAIDSAPLDLVVLVLDGGRQSPAPGRAAAAWTTPARLAASYQAAGVPVVTVSAGAAAGMLASCVAKGAPALFSLDHLPDALRTLVHFPDGELLGASEPSLPPRFAALVGLTSSERRVLFYLTEGWAAQDIADELVVSLTTVRSHIRSVLRKLGVRSQLAAVAIANSRDLEDRVSGEAL
jgi:DNA-binding NarL/FixJ family response regulator